MYDLNHIPYADVAKLIKQWTTDRLQISPGLQFQACKDDPTIQSGSPLVGESRLELVDENLPSHVYFLVDTATISGKTAKQDYMGCHDWPF
jgi:hypothetical protein